ncbi:Sel1 repeat [Thalassovita gelatinovora]|uniref:Sel1 repeat n=1 Tax=Thalassovita gelatinovora TaxID=53501 RepID=A0A0P1G2L7_THAGE|nr:Sel1 repeat [Thalassovita gelatinovora]SEP72484.1 TPR repeat [Thalassovita gelatinovora]
MISILRGISLTGKKGVSATLLWVTTAIFIGSAPVPVSAAPSQAVVQADKTLWTDTATETDLEQARQALETAAAQGDVDAQQVLGVHLLNGWVLEKDVPQAIALLDQAAQSGVATAQLELGQAYLWGTEIPADAAKAQDLLNAAAAQNNPDAMRVLGEQLIGGWALPRDVGRGRPLLEAAIAGGDDKAMVALGKLLLYGQGVAQDHAEAMNLFEAAAAKGNGSGLAAYGDMLMWGQRSPKTAEAVLNRAGELGVGEAWVTLAHGAMYGYLGGGRVSRAKFDGYAEKARQAGEEDIVVLEATRNMWGINMRASGPETIARLRTAADAENAAAAKFLIELLRDGNGLNLLRRRADARAALETYADLLTLNERAQFALTIDAATAVGPAAFAAVADAYFARPELKSRWFGTQILKANENVAYFILQKQLKDDGLYGGRVNGYATRLTLRAAYRACLELDRPERCRDNVMRPDVIGDLLAR